ncbi:MAG: response regulator transcription factor [Gammaproteobacteria bacterium]|nr:response regulator transcription factor [Gammaproteobacteria bacterium]
MRVLIADDQNSIRNVIKMIVTDMGGEIAGEACNGQEAVDRYSEVEPDLVLLDINMPKMDGVEALRKIKELYPDACAAMLTSQNTNEMVRACIGYGASHFILKTNPETIQLELEKIWKELN